MMLHKLADFFGHTLKRRLIVGVSSIVIACMALLIWTLTYQQVRHAQQQHVKQATALATATAAATTNAIAARDVSALQEIIIGLKDYPDLEHAMILNPQGQIFAHIEPKFIGLFLHDVPTKGQAQLLTNTEQLIDLIYPITIQQATLGWVRIGLNNQQLHTEQTKIIQNGLIYSLFGLMISILFASIITRYLTAQLEHIKTVTDHVRSGNTSARTELEGQSEITNLGQEINHMLDDLETKQRRIQQLAYFDNLTGLANRFQLIERLRSIFVMEAHPYFALLFLDLDYFKTLNDTLGHDTGDLLLQEVAHRLTQITQDQGIVFRLGGDEFVILITNMDDNPQHAQIRVEAFAAAVLKAINTPFTLGVHEHKTSSSIGIVVFQPGVMSHEELLKQADIAMYQAKRAGRNQVRIFDPAMQDEINHRADMEREINRAIAQQQFELYFQPQLDANQGLIGAETLIRWPHPERGMISPGQFIPVAEETGQILAIGDWVLESACAQLAQWQQNPETVHLLLSVNVSAEQFFQQSFVQRIEGLLSKYHLDGRKLKLELTESMLLTHVDEIIQIMLELKQIGVRFSLDDFGTGYSSLQYLKRLPLDQLKIDQSFVRDLGIDRNDAVIVDTIIAMARSLALDVIAEGVETDAQKAILTSLGCLKYQGYLLGKPMDINSFTAYLATEQNQAKSSQTV